jgi:hypothetical protein
MLTFGATCRTKPNARERSPRVAGAVRFGAERSVSWIDPCRKRPQAPAAGFDPAVKIRPAPPVARGPRGAPGAAAPAMQGFLRAARASPVLAEGKRPFALEKRSPKARPKARESERDAGPNGRFSLFAAVRPGGSPAVRARGLPKTTVTRSPRSVCSFARLERATPSDLAPREVPRERGGAKIPGVSSACAASRVFSFDDCDERLFPRMRSRNGHARTRPARDSRGDGRRTTVPE